MEDIIERIEVQRGLNKVSVKDLSAACGISSVTYWRFINKRTELKFSVVMRMFTYLGLKVLVYA